MSETHKTILIYWFWQIGHLPDIYHEGSQHSANINLEYYWNIKTLSYHLRFRINCL